MSKFKYYLYAALLFILLLLVLPYGWEIICNIFLSKAPILTQLDAYKWAAIGVLIAMFIGSLFSKNQTWFETFSHELTHIVVALMFFRKVHSFHAESGTGAVTTSGTNQKGIIPMALAPYCLPIFTYLLLFLRPLMNSTGSAVLDVFIGASIVFHYLCFKHQTGNHQTDINQYPFFFSYTYIYIARLVNVCIILVAFWPGYNVFTSMWRLFCSLYGNAAVFVEWVYNSLVQ